MGSQISRLKILNQFDYIQIRIILNVIQKEKSIERLPLEVFKYQDYLIFTVIKELCSYFSYI